MTTQPVIIKKKRGGKGDGHHGGAWKVAYADFVTAMMAFFLLMWLLNATTEEQRKGIADYFDPAIPVSPVSGGGTDMLSGDSVFSTDSFSSDNHGGESSEMADDAELVSAVTASLGDVMKQDQFMVTLSDEGVVIELLEAEEAPLFALGNARPSALLEGVVQKITPVLSASGRPVKIVGHTDALPFRNGGRYTNWELSADRANVARRLAVANGLPHLLLKEVVGKADRSPLVADTSAPQNRRISIIMLKAEKVISPVLLEAH